MAVDYRSTVSNEEYQTIINPKRLGYVPKSPLADNLYAEFTKE